MKYCIAFCLISMATTSGISAIGGQWITVGSMTKGQRAYQEDRVLLHMDNGRPLCAVFDGHGGHVLSQTAGERFVPFFTEAQGNTQEKMRVAFQRIEDEEKGKENYSYGVDPGTTALVATVDNANKLHIGWVGDSRGAVVSGEKIVAETIDHKPRVEEERIKRAGGFVGCGRLGEHIAVSRALGDCFFKAGERGRGLIADSEFIEAEVLDGTCVVLASDGFWDMCSNKDVISILSQKNSIPAEDTSDSENFIGSEAIDLVNDSDLHSKPPRVKGWFLLGKAQKMRMCAQQKDSRDNISVVLMQYSAKKSETKDDN